MSGLLMLFAALASFSLIRGAAESDADFFERRIRPVLVEHCYSCHSAESEKVKGGLLLDSKAGVARGGESGPVIVPGDVEGSLLIKAVRWGDEKLQMPPKKKLSASAIADLEAWVKLGAKYPESATDATKATNGLAGAQRKAVDHWAFKKPQKFSVPAVKEGSWPRTEMDHFILAKLEAENLRPAAGADRRTWLRRASYDLTGLPPSYEEVLAFEQDNSPEAYERVIDRLLDSPAYGERWGRHWLDVARFADTKGYVYSDREEPQFVHSHVYRDWVMKAFNEDMPYDEFLVAQIAGDQLETKGLEGLDSPLAGMGFLTVGRRFLGVTHDIIDDRIDTLTKATQGLTVSCARCHDHKFDPISIQDYYSLYGVFSASTERSVQLESAPAETKEFVEFKKGYDERVAKLQGSFEKHRGELLAKVRAKTTEYLLAVLEADKLPTEDHYEIRGPEDLNPTIARQWQSYLFQTAKEFHPVWAPWHEFAKLPKSEFAERARQLNLQSNTNLNAAVRTAFVTNAPGSMVEVAKVYGALLAEVNRKHLEKAELGAAERELRELEDVLYGAESPVAVPAGSVWDVEWFFHEAVRVEFGKLQSEIDRWIIKAAGAPKFAVTLVDRPNQKNPRVFRRGNPANRGEEVPRRYLELIAGADGKAFANGSGRLEMAQMIASAENPLTARVMVNRVWANHFGEGLVRTLNDFGTRSEAPTHPELLDWLATYFVENRWSVKKLHRLIMLSRTYQQSATASEEAVARDPQNRLLSHMNRRRLGFEELRDSLLRASGELTLEAGGKPQALFGPKLVAKRAVYGFVDRQFLPGVYRVFDFPNPDLPSGQRALTTVPQQALYLMNNRFLMDRARVLNAGAEGSSAERRVAELYRRVFQREPSSEEMKSALAFVESAEALKTPEPPPPPPPSAWSYGYGKVVSGKIGAFKELPHFAENAWQGGNDYPDAKLGWVKLTEEGGHAGNDLDHAAIRRWTAPVSGEFRISGVLEHKRKEGDGIHAAVVSSRQGVLGEWNLHNVKTKTEFERVQLEKGDTIDFVVDIRGTLNNDDFVWTPTIKQIVEASAKYEKSEWDAKKEFGGPPQIAPAPLKPWESLAQALLISNEFVFVD